MKKSYGNKHPSLSSSDLRFYEPISKINTTQTIYELTRGNREENTFRKKKISDCHDLNYSSCLNPFARNTVRYDRNPYQYDKKKPVPYVSNAPTDPVTMKYEVPPKQIRVRPQFVNTIQYQSDVEKRYYLPSDREVSGNKRRYYPQQHFGLSGSLQKAPKIRQTQNSSRIRPILEYAEADHYVEKITPKVGYVRR